jgi:signal transduction histidine kinase
VADRRWAGASVRTRTTVAAVLVVAIALIAGAFTLVILVRQSLRDGVETSADQRASSLADEIDSSGLPPQQPSDDEAGDIDDPEDEVWQVTDSSGAVVRTSQQLAEPLPRSDRDEASLDGADHPYLVVTQDAGEYDVAVAVSLEEVDDSTDALLPPLLVGVPLLLLVVGSTTWVVSTRALAPVERIRTEVDQITGDQLERRVPEPPSRDEIHRLASTMNRMLARLEGSRDRQRQFVADASHELRSPLASLRQTAEVAQAHPGALPEGELAAAVMEEGARMQRLVEQLLLLTRADEGGVARNPRDVDVDDLVLTEARRARRAGLTVDVTDVRGGRVRGEEVALAQVVRNLVDNAERHAEALVRISVDESGSDVNLVIEDDGPGVPEDQRERVFERFVRLDEARARDDGGSGLGLAIVEEIVRAHGGSVSVSASELGGARFAVRLPRPESNPV